MPASSFQLPASRFQLRRAAAIAAAIAIGAIIQPSVVLGHDIPSAVTVQMFVRPEAQHLRVLVRVPMAAMRDIDFPTRGQDFLDLGRSSPALRDAAMLWIAESLQVYEDRAALAPPRLAAACVSLPSDRSFGSWDAAVAHVTGAPLPHDVELPVRQGMLDVLFDYQVRSDSSRFSIDPTFARLGTRVVTVLRFIPAGGEVRAFEYTGDPGLVRLDPSWRQAAVQFVRLGFSHILQGTDHLLFLFCLVMPLRAVRQLVMVVTSFTVAHSITLIASCHGFVPDGLWFPPLIETLIATSIVYMALENIVFSARSVDTASLTARVGANLSRRWMITFAFGLVHGLGFSFALRESLQFGGSHLLASLLSFNVGVELGQLLVLAMLVPMLNILFRFVVAERIGVIILSAFVAHTAWHWTLERGARLSQYRWPQADIVMLAGLTRWAMVVVALAAAAWVVMTLLRHFAARRVEQNEST